MARIDTLAAGEFQNGFDRVFLRVVDHDIAAVLERELAIREGIDSTPMISPAPRKRAPTVAMSPTGP
jgi:hypothetical protein